MTAVGSTPTVGLIPHTGKPEAVALTREVIDALRRRSADFLLEVDVAELLDSPERGRDLGSWSDVTVAMVLGGDGAILRAARAVAPHGVPLLGVNFGHFGFLSEVEAESADALVERVLAQDYSIESRMMLDVQVFRGDRRLGGYVALNDAVVSRGTFARIVGIETRSDGEEVLNFAGDGVVVATPTGSTAYSLSAGGPIVNPLLECFVVTPICPHALSTRSVVVQADEKLEIVVSAAHDDIMLTIDGQVGMEIRPGDRIAITRATHVTRLVRLEDRSFYRVLRSRMSQRPL